MDQYSYIFKEKFRNNPAPTFLEENAGQTVDKILDFYAKKRSEENGPEENSLREIPTKDSPFFLKLTQALEDLDREFGSNVFRKVDSTLDDNIPVLLQKAYSTLPSVHITGNFETAFLSSLIACAACERTELLRTEITLTTKW